MALPPLPALPVRCSPSHSPLHGGALNAGGGNHNRTTPSPNTASTTAASTSTVGKVQSMKTNSTNKNKENVPPSRVQLLSFLTRSGGVASHISMTMLRQLDCMNKSMESS